MPSDSCLLHSTFWRMPFDDRLAPESILGIYISHLWNIVKNIL